MRLRWLTLSGLFFRMFTLSWTNQAAKPLLFAGLLGKADGFRGADIGARSALGAEVGVDRILFAFGNGLRRTFALTCTACDTIVSNYISHIFSFFLSE